MLGFCYYQYRAIYNCLYAEWPWTKRRVEVNDGAVIALPGLTATTNFEILTISDNSLPDCVFPGNASWEVVVNDPIEPGTALAPPEICVGTETMVSLTELLENAPAGGTWVETSGSPSSGGAFNPAYRHNLILPVRTPGTYAFTYQIAGPAPCPDVSVEVEVIVVPAPIADAGLGSGTNL